MVCYERCLGSTEHVIKCLIFFLRFWPYNVALYSEPLRGHWESCLMGFCWIISDFIFINIKWTSRASHGFYFLSIMFITAWDLFIVSNNIKWKLFFPFIFKLFITHFFEKADGGKEDVLKSCKRIRVFVVFVWFFDKMNEKLLRVI